MWKKILLILVIDLLILFSTAAIADLSYYWFPNRYEIHVVPETGVNYMVIEEYSSFGNSIAFCPRYDSNGNIYVGAKKE